MHRAVLPLVAALISGCTTSTEELFPQDGPTMVDVYNTHLTGLGQESQPDIRKQPQRPLEQGIAFNEGQVVSYTRTAENEIENLFPTLENPNLVMYVFPHLTSGERLPVPGYSTSFPMFERTEFALPGETRPPPSEKPKPRIRIVSGDSRTSSIRVH